MVFSDPIFLLLFLPAFMLIYFLIRPSLQLLTIIVFSIGFYVVGEWLYTLVLFFVLYITILFVILHQAKPETRFLAPLSIGLILATLVVFKYTGFLAQQFGIDGEVSQIVNHAQEEFRDTRPVTIKIPGGAENVRVVLETSLLLPGQSDKEIPAPIRKIKDPLKRSIIVTGYQAVWAD